MREFFYVAIKSGLPYSGPTWERAGIKRKWFEDEGEAKIAAETLGRFSEAIFFVEKLGERLKPVDYPFFEKK